MGNSQSIFNSKTKKLAEIDCRKQDPPLSSLPPQVAKLKKCEKFIVCM
jgi:hypothetical protein